MILPWDHPELAGAQHSGRRVLAEVCSLTEARAAVEAGARELIAKGSESGGRVGDTGTFVLLQMLLDDPAIDVDVWAQGGIGPLTAAAAVAGGARGVVLDSQLALVAESALPLPTASALRSMDGSETVVIDGHRVFSRPDLPVARLAAQGVASRLGSEDLQARLLPVGQDGAFAAPLAARYRTAGGVVSRFVQPSRKP